jgi:hypothetical protein
MLNLFQKEEVHEEHQVAEYKEVGMKGYQKPWNKEEQEKKENDKEEKMNKKEKENQEDKENEKEVEMMQDKKNNKRLLLVFPS